MARRKDPDQLLSNREVVYLDNELKEFSAIYCHERNKPFTELVRLALRFYKRYLETELSKEKQRLDSAKSGTSSAQAGSLSPEQLQIVIAVADLIRSQSGDRRKSPRV